jgi:hypothetical protein
VPLRYIRIIKEREKQRRSERHFDFEGEEVSN